jgi:mono/diheme cytochrome c family protein
MDWKTGFVAFGTFAVLFTFDPGVVVAQGEALDERALGERRSAQTERGRTLAERGQMVWAGRGCAVCHTLGKNGVAPDLFGLTQRRPREWLVKWLRDSDEMLRSDSTARALLKEFKWIRMPSQYLGEADVEALLAFIESESTKPRK